ncbi:MAG: GSCFA domain-containing protein [Bacteroidales bacterium]|nr:GSCFA domain-containing protein [Bacteroidales bacterium]MDT8431959.1 GSCFA domain-containing protein [Bacteroidales bacterium]
MKFRSEITLPEIKVKIGYEKPVIMLGSCFTENIGSFLEKHLFNVVVNPFGVIYNPFSIRNAIEALMYKDSYTIEDLNRHDELWFSFDHYTKFSDPDQHEAVRKINVAFEKAKARFHASGRLILTFGTAYIYALKLNGRIVNNCHKIPAREFNRRRLTIGEITGAYADLIKKILIHRPDMQLLFTVSPVRHLKDGFVENQRSKAILLLAIDQLVKTFPGTCDYFPSYEIMMDDLRDYRYYDNDLVHPNELGMNYISELFREHCLDARAQQVAGELDPLLKTLSHRPLHTETEAYRKFTAATGERIRKLKSAFPFLQWSKISDLTSF